MGGDRTTWPKTRASGVPHRFKTSVESCEIRQRFLRICQPGLSRLANLDRSRVIILPNCLNGPLKRLDDFCLNSDLGLNGFEVLLEPASPKSMTL
jgi:hypothetical protein